MIRGLAILVACGALCEFRAATAAGTVELFSTHEPLVMELAADLAGFCRNPDDEDCPDLPGVITYIDSNGQQRSIEVELRIRGRWAEHTANCSLPSLFVVFESASTADTVFERQTELPLTTHCHSRSKYEQYLLKEYVAHRIYNLVAEKSLKARLARITYRDTSGGSDPIQRYGFFTEHFRLLADRFDAEVWSPQGRFDHSSASPFELAALSLFQFMIGNTDWSILAGHNITYIRGRDWVTPVPFDLDFSGLVNAEYAGPPPGLGLFNVRQRLYRGICRPDTDWLAIFEHFTDRRSAILQLVSNAPGLERSYRRNAAAYLTSFFEILDSRRQRNRRIVEACRRL